jgi:hypothetical protein
MKKGKKGLKQFLEAEGYTKIYYRLIMSLVILSILLVAIIAYYVLFYMRPCNSNDCFINSFDKCKKVSFIKEDSQATWQYKLIGNEGKGKCKVEVYLQRLNQGTVENQRLEGKLMVCLVGKESALEVEGDLSKCSGALKEEMQEVVIQRMHNYLLKNCGEIKVNFNASL